MGCYAGWGWGVSAREKISRTCVVVAGPSPSATEGITALGFRHEVGNLQKCVGAFEMSVINVLLCLLGVGYDPDPLGVSHRLHVFAKMNSTTLHSTPMNSARTL